MLMSFSEVIQLISNVGFPIAVSIAMFWLINGTLNKLINTVDKNTEIINKILTKLENLHNEDDKR